MSLSVIKDWSGRIRLKHGCGHYRNDSGNLYFNHKYAVFHSYSHQYFLLFQLYSNDCNTTQLENDYGYLKHFQGWQKVHSNYTRGSNATQVHPVPIGLIQIHQLKRFESDISFIQSLEIKSFTLYATTVRTSIALGFNHSLSTLGTKMIQR